MKNEFLESLNSVLLFFEGNFDPKKIHPIKDFLGLPNIKLVHYVSYYINHKHQGDYSYLIITNQDKSLKIVFVGKHLFNSNKDEYFYAMFCVKNDYIWEYQNNQGGIFLSKGSFSSYVGLNAIVIAKRFCEKVAEDELKMSKNELIKDILEHFKENS